MDKKYLIILILVALGVYANTLANGFIWDDEDLILEDRYIKDIKYAGYLFTPEYWKQNFVAHEGRYRPLRALTFIVDWNLWKKNPIGYHLTNMILNLVAVLSVYFLAQNLFADGIKSFFSALIFAVHPVHTESVCWIKNRTDILMTIFFVLGVAWFIGSVRRWQSNETPSADTLSTRNNGLMVGIMFILALLGKEAAITMPVVLMAYLLLAERENFGSSVKKLWLYFALSALYFVFLIVFLRTSQIKSPIDIKGNILALAQYLRLLILPYDLNAERGLVTGVDLVGPVFFAAVIYLVVKKKLYREAFALGWIFITLLPVLDVRFITSRPIAEQRLYLPSVGLCLLAGSTLSRKIWSRILLIGIIMTFTGITFARNFDWKDSVRFWEKTVEQSPDSARAWHNLGVGYERSNDWAKAVAMYEKSILLNKTMALPYISIGNIAYNSGNPSVAEQFFNQALGVSPDSVEAKKGLARVMMAKGDLTKAMEIYRQILSVEPANTEVLNAYGVVLWQSGKKEQAREVFDKVSQLEPENTASLYNLARMYQEENEIADSVRIYEKILQIEPTNADALNNLGIAYLMSDEKDKAEEIFKNLVAIKPDYYPAHYNLGNIYFDKKLYLEALAEFTRVKEIKPDHRMAKLKIEEIKKLVSKNEYK